ncbi:MAG TPA: divergent polysaccharide deacetylase family protein [Planctomycetota bacterium]|nr:divergent polysaccharide deacetylase family protein [Planctomycetota bacterium]
MAIPLAGMAIFFLWQWWNGGITPEQAAVQTKAAVLAPRPASVAEKTNPSMPAAPPPSPHAAARHRSVEEPSGHDGAIVLIIDDLGFDGQPLERIMALDPNVNLAILPNGTRATDFAERLHARGFEVLCHLPMQPRGRERPGRNAILTSMSDDEIARATRENVGAIPYAIGVNNHMGSLATADRRVMTSVLGALPSGMYFVDSRTGSRSVAATVAREMNVRTATRNVFLDDVVTERAVRQQVAALADAARRRGMAVGIGHPHAVTLRVLAEEVPRLRKLGFRFVRASEVVR